VTVECVTSDSAIEHSYAALVSPRTARDLAAINVVIHPGNLGSGKPEQGGGPLRGGLTLMNRFKVDIGDPGLPYDIHLTVGARDGWLACEAVTIGARPGGPAVTSLAVRYVALGVYVQRIREELQLHLGALLVVKETGRTESTVSYSPPMSSEDWDTFDVAQLRRAARAAALTPEMAAKAYREALASPDPRQNKRPTAAAAEKLGVSRGHVSRLVTQARHEGSPGLGPMRKPRGRQAERDAGGGGEEK
jgi:hypothetical protein